MAPAIAVAEIEQSADRALAYALLARLAKAYLKRLYRMKEVSGAMDDLLQVLSIVNVEALAADNSTPAVRLKRRLQELHSLLAQWARSQEPVELGTLPVIGSLVHRIQDRTEDLGDFVDAIALASNADFKSLVSCCATALSLETPEELVGRM